MEFPRTVDRGPVKMYGVVEVDMKAIRQRVGDPEDDGSWWFKDEQGRPCRLATESVGTYVLWTPDYYTSRRLVEYLLAC